MWSTLEGVCQIGNAVGTAALGYGKIDRYSGGTRSSIDTVIAITEYHALSAEILNGLFGTTIGLKRTQEYK